MNGGSHWQSIGKKYVNYINVRDELEGNNVEVVVHGVHTAWTKQMGYKSIEKSANMSKQIASTSEACVTVFLPVNVGMVKEGSIHVKVDTSIRGNVMPLCVFC